MLECKEQGKKKGMEGRNEEGKLEGKELGKKGSKENGKE